MPNNKNGRPSRPRLLLGALAFTALLLVAVVSAALVLPRWRAQQAAETVEEPHPLTVQETADIKAAVKKEAGATVRAVWRNRQGQVEVLTGGPGERGFGYRVRKVEGRWRVIEKFLAFSA